MPSGPDRDRFEPAEMSSVFACAPESFVFPATMTGWISRNWTRLALAAIIVSACSLSLYWVFLVPIFQAGDEDHHFDYALNIYSAGRLLSAREAPGPWNTVANGTRYGPPIMLHVYTLYLIHVTDEDGILTRPGTKVPAGYGTASYYRELDKHVPQRSEDAPAPDARKKYGILTLYPFGYYGLVAAWMGGIGNFAGNRLSVLFFSARILSVILLGLSLLLSYAIFRRLRLKPGRGLFLTAAVGFFPLTSYVSSYVQPDNLSFALVMLCCYLALLLREKPGEMRLQVFLGLALGALLVTKYHFYLCVLLPVVAMLVVRRAGHRQDAKRRPWTITSAPGWLKFFAVLLLPSVLLGLVQLWVVWGSPRNTVGGNPNLDDTAIASALSPGGAGLVSFILHGFSDAFKNYYLGGMAFDSYWGNFGWVDVPLVIVSRPFTAAVMRVVMAVALVLLALGLVRFVSVGRRLISVARRGRRRAALSMTFSNPLINSYFLFTALMLALYVYTSNSFTAQGRDWFPFIGAAFLASTDYLPRLLSRRRARQCFSAALMLALGLYCIAGSYYAIETIRARYY
jgi:hypothetical protein